VQRRFPPKIGLSTRPSFRLIPPRPAQSGGNPGGRLRRVMGYGVQSAIGLHGLVVGAGARFP
jgi:hypothetical protein